MINTREVEYIGKKFKIKQICLERATTIFDYQMFTGMVPYNKKEEAIIEAVTIIDEKDGTSALTKESLNALFIGNGLKFNELFFDVMSVAMEDSLKKSDGSDPENVKEI